MSDALDARRQPFAVWLIPEKKQAKYLSGIITYLSQEYETPSFEPHCTLISGISTDISSVKETVGRLLRTTQQLSLETNGIKSTDNFFKSVFIELVVTVQLENIFEDFKTAIPENHSPSLDPHISLIYKDMEEEKKQEIAESLEIPLDEITFNTVKIICPPDNERGWYAIDSCKTVFEKQLTGSK